MRMKVALSFLLIATAGHAQDSRRGHGWQKPTRSVDAGNARTGSRTVQANSVATFGHLPMSFEQNVGQTNGQVQFLSRGGGYTLFLAPAEAVIKLSGQNHGQGNTSSVLRMKMEGAKWSATVKGLDQLPGVSNYFIGNDPSKWRTGVASYAKVQYSDIYPGVDLVYYGNKGQIEYDFIVKSGADPSQVSMAIDGAQRLTLDNATGDISVQTASGQVGLRKPLIYQMEYGQKKLIKGNYKLRGNNRVAFEVKSFNHMEPLVIDPIVLVGTTYLDGSNDLNGNIEYAPAIDATGAAYLAGSTDATDFPVGTSISAAPTPGTTLGFVAKLTPAGTALAYSTYIGGTDGVGDGIIGVAVDANGFAYLSGYTTSSDFPTASAFQGAHGGAAGSSNSTLSKLSADGQTLMFSTYLGSGPSDSGIGIAVDGSENAYMVGYTQFAGFPVVNGFQNTLKSANGNGYLARFDTRIAGAGSLVYSTMIGGTGGNAASALQVDYVNAVSIDGAGNAYIVGNACSSDFPVTASAFSSTVGAFCSAFLAQIDTTKSGGADLVYSTTLGGTSAANPNQWGDSADGVVWDGANKVYVAGTAASSDFPVTTGATYTSPGLVFVARFDTSLSGASSLVFSTLLNVWDDGFPSVNQIAVDTSHRVYIAATTGAPGAFSESGAIQSCDVLPNLNPTLTVLGTDGSLAFGSCLGGSGTPNELVAGVALDPTNNIYIAGMTQSQTLGTPGTFQGSAPNTTGVNNYVMKLTPLP